MYAIAIGSPELLILLAVILLFVGARQLPKMARAVGLSITELRNGLKGDGQQSLDEQK